MTYGYPTRNEGSDITSRKGTVQAALFAGGADERRSSQACEGARLDEVRSDELSDTVSICCFLSSTFCRTVPPSITHLSYCRLPRFDKVGVRLDYSW